MERSTFPSSRSRAKCSARLPSTGLCKAASRKPRAPKRPRTGKPRYRRRSRHPTRLIRPSTLMLARTHPAAHRSGPWPWRSLVPRRSGCDQLPRSPLPHKASSSIQTISSTSNALRTDSSVAASPRDSRIATNSASAVGDTSARSTWVPRRNSLIPRCALAVAAAPSYLITQSAADVTTGSIAVCCHLTGVGRHVESAPRDAKCQHDQQGLVPTLSVAARRCRRHSSSLRCGRSTLTAPTR